MSANGIISGDVEQASVNCESCAVPLYGTPDGPPYCCAECAERVRLGDGSLCESHPSWDTITIGEVKFPPPSATHERRADLAGLLANPITFTLRVDRHERERQADGSLAVVRRRGAS